MISRHHGPCFTTDFVISDSMPTPRPRFPAASSTTFGPQRAGTSESTLSVPTSPLLSLHFELSKLSEI